MLEQLKDLDKRTLMASITTISILLLANGIKIYATEDISTVMQQGIDECHAMDTEFCEGAMHTIDYICQVEYFESCFGNKWSEFVDHNGEINSNPKTK